MTRDTDSTELLDDLAKDSTQKKACLYVVATPIGNLDDITPRALHILQQVAVIAAEDTRLTQKLLQHLGLKGMLKKEALKTQLLSLHDHNEKARSQQLLQRLVQGQSVALVSDAGTPLISDPGYTLVREVRAAGFEVLPVPGVSAVVTALSVAGLATDRFHFVGFLPAKVQARSELLKALRSQPATLVFYESPHRLLASLEAMQQAFGAERRVFLAREMTKRFETYRQTTLADMRAWVAADSNQQRGELVLVVEGFQGEVETVAWQEACRWLQALQEEMPPARACALVARMTGVKKKALYTWMLAQTDARLTDADKT